MNKRVRKHLNSVDDQIASARELVNTGDYRGAACALDGAKAAVNLAAAEDRRAREKRDASNFVRNTL